MCNVWENVIFFFTNCVHVRAMMLKFSNVKCPAHKFYNKDVYNMDTIILLITTFIYSCVFASHYESLITVFGS